MPNHDDRSIIPFHIEYTMTAPFDADCEDYLSEITGKLICGKMGTEDELEAGQIRALFLDLANAASVGYTASVIFDIDSHAWEHYQVLYDRETDEIKEEISEKYGKDLYGHNMLILERLEIYPEFRGMKLGLAAIYRTIQRFGHYCSFISLQVGPLQFDAVNDPQKAQWFADMQLATFSSDSSQATKQLKAYYAQLGFREVEGTDIMLLNPAYNTPSLEDIGFR